MTFVDQPDLFVKTVNDFLHNVSFCSWAWNASSHLRGAGSVHER